jgi:hypothetical protein
VLYSYSSSSEGIGVQIDGQQKGTLPGGIALPPGSYHLRLVRSYDNTVLYQGGVDVHPGELIDVSSLLPLAKRIDVAVTVGGFLPASRSAISTLSSGMPLVGLLMGLRHFPFAWMRAEVEGSYFAAGGNDTSNPGATVPFGASGWRASGALLGEFHPSSILTVGVGAGAGALFLSRTYQGAFTGNETLRAPTASGVVELTGSTGDRLALGARFETLCIFGRIDGRPRSAAVVPSAFVSFTF